LINLQYTPGISFMKIQSGQSAKNFTSEDIGDHLPIEKINEWLENSQ